MFYLQIDIAKPRRFGRSSFNQPKPVIMLCFTSQAAPATLLVKFLQEVDQYNGSPEDIVKHSEYTAELLIRPKPPVLAAIIDAIEKLPPTDSSDKVGGKRFKALTELILHVTCPPKRFSKKEFGTVAKTWVNLCQVLARL